MTEAHSLQKLRRRLLEQIAMKTRLRIHPTGARGHTNNIRKYPRELYDGSGDGPGVKTDISRLR